LNFKAILCRRQVRNKAVRIPFSGKRAPSQVTAGGPRLDAMARLALASATVIALFAAGCGDDTVDSAQVEKAIKGDVSAAGASASSVKCPDDVKSEKGASFNCDVTTTNGATGKVKVTQQGGNRYKYALVPGSLQVPGSVAEKEIEDQLASQGVNDASANCPDNIIVKLGTSVTCDVTGVKGVGKVTFSWSDSSGTVDESSVATST
jgi:hypothetical protein